MTSLKKPVSRVSLERLSGAYGPDKNRRVVITLSNGNGGDVPDLITLRPLRTRRAYSVSVGDLYSYLLRCRVNAKMMAKLREKKAKKEAAAKKRAWARELKKEL